MTTINYDVNIAEIETAFTLFWRKYALKRTVLFTIVFAISVVLCIHLMFTSVGKAQSAMVGAVGLGLSVGLGTNLWLKPRRVRKKLVAAIEMLGEETYSATFKGDEIEVITTTLESESEETESEQEQASETGETGEAEPKVDKTVYAISDEELYSVETGEMFVLFVNRSLFHVFPKRCLNEQSIEELQNYFTTKRI